MSGYEETGSEFKQKKAHRHTLVFFLVGLLVGGAAMGAAVATALPKMTIVTQESLLGFDETVAALQKAIPAQGWVVSPVSDMNQSMARLGYEFAPRVKLVKMCNPEYAMRVLIADRYVSAMMPCTLAVWEGDDGKVYISKLNMPLLARMFGGNIAKVMGRRVAEDEQVMLAGIVQD